jgi:hypothetical protein
MTRKNTHHPFHGEPAQGPCGFCGEPYETRDERHSFYGKLINPLTRAIRPFVLADYDREARELGMPAWAEDQPKSPKLRP